MKIFKLIYLTMLFLMFSISFTAHSFELSPNQKEHLKKLKKYLDEKEVCLLASVTVYEGCQEKNSKYTPGQWSCARYKVNCISDITQKPGSIHEKSGCSLTQYDAEKGKHILFSKGFPMAMASKKCMDGGFKELVNKRGKWNYLSVARSVKNNNKGDSVEKVFFEKITDAQRYNEILLFHEASEMEKWFHIANKKNQVLHKAEHVKLVEKKRRARALEKKYEEEKIRKKEEMERKLLRKYKKKKAFDDLY
jgi:hypothetical protein